MVRIIKTALLAAYLMLGSGCFASDGQDKQDLEDGSARPVSNATQVSKSSWKEAYDLVQSRALYCKTLNEYLGQYCKEDLTDDEKIYCGHFIAGIFGDYFSLFALDKESVEKTYVRIVKASMITNLLQNVIKDTVVLKVFAKAMKSCDTVEKRKTLLPILLQEFKTYESANSGALMTLEKEFLGVDSRVEYYDDMQLIYSSIIVKSLEAYAASVSIIIEPFDEIFVYVVQDDDRCKQLKNSEFRDEAKINFDNKLSRSSAKEKAENNPPAFKRIAKSGGCKDIRNIHDGSGELFISSFLAFKDVPTKLQRTFSDEFTSFFENFDFTENFKDANSALVKKLKRKQRQEYQRAVKKASNNNDYISHLVNLKSHKKKTKGRNKGGKKKRGAGGRRKGKNNKGRKRGNTKRGKHCKNKKTKPRKGTGESKKAAAQSQLLVANPQNNSGVAEPEATTSASQTTISTTDTSSADPNGLQVATSTSNAVTITAEEEEEEEDDPAIAVVNPVVAQLDSAGISLDELEGYASVFLSDSKRTMFSFDGTRKRTKVSWNNLSWFLQNQGWTIDTSLSTGSSVSFRAPDRFAQVDGFESKRIVVHKPKDTKGILPQGRRSRGYLVFFRNGFANCGLTEARLNEYINLLEASEQ